MRLVVPALAVAVLFSACVGNSFTEHGTGGAPGTGGKPGTGGAPGTGGKGTGGSGTGGARTTVPSGTCPDVTTSVSYSINQQYGNGIIAVDNNANKNYNFMSNWWSAFSNQSEDIKGIGFTLHNTASSSSNNPLGFPSMFIGSYMGKGTKGSNLPKQVNALSSVPTFIHSNATSLDTSNFNVTYDVWFTSSSSLVTGSSPGSGGAYLMVWLFKPSKRQPRGTIALDGDVIAGVPGTWTVWYDGATNPPCVSFVSTTPLSNLDFDLNNFIQEAVDNKWGVTNSQYLSIVFGGTEVWGGGDGLQIKEFCADVK